MCFRLALEIIEAKDSPRHRSKLSSKNDSASAAAATMRIDEALTTAPQAVLNVADKHNSEEQ